MDTDIFWMLKLLVAKKNPTTPKKPPTNKQKNPKKNDWKAKTLKKISINRFQWSGSGKDVHKFFTAFAVPLILKLLLDIN